MARGFHPKTQSRTRGKWRGRGNGSILHMTVLQATTPSIKLVLGNSGDASLHRNPFRKMRKRGRSRIIKRCLHTLWVGSIFLGLITRMRKMQKYWGYRGGSPRGPEGRHEAAINAVACIRGVGYCMLRCSIFTSEHASGGKSGCSTKILSPSHPLVPT